MRKEFIEVAENLGWFVDVDGIDVTFEKSSPAGEDFYFSVKDDGGVDEWVADYATSFDEEEHVEMWMEAKRNGVQGVPCIRDLLDDAEEIKAMLLDLAVALQEAE